ncbi:MAG: hypothetical protein V3V41_07925 [Candidatus Heimdallarchaeota archaeon]
MKLYQCEQLGTHGQRVYYVHVSALVRMTELHEKCEFCDETVKQWNEYTGMNEKLKEIMPNVYSDKYIIPKS